jgi:hypothetical protein
MLMLSTELSNKNSLLHVRNAAGLALQNTLTARVSKKGDFIADPPCRRADSLEIVGGPTAKRLDDPMVESR